ncbi:MAG: hypothetical protein KC425_23360 [Anaerolineales bacterium]|nr:hypothetical protein [Anaerolineales bacterium]
MRDASQTVGGRLSSRLILTFVAIVLASTLAAGALAYWLTRTELEQQAWARLADGQRVTQTLLDADRRRLDNLVALAAQRPTLQQMLHNGDTAGLHDYVSQFQAGTELDLLVIYDAGGEVLVGGSGAVLCGRPQREKSATLCLLPGPAPRLSLLAGQSILDASSGRLLGYVMMAIFMDDDYASRLAAETGLAQSILVDGSRIATSLDEAGAPLDETTTTRALAATTFMTRSIALADQPYITALFPLRRVEGDVLALAEVALPLGGMRAAEQHIALTLIASTLFVAAAGSAAALTLRRTLTDEAMQHLRSHFLANITHEFRTPLSALRASVEFLVDEMADLSRAEIDDLLRAIHMSVTGLQTLVDNLLESIRIEAGHFAIRPKSIELDDVVYEAARIMQPLLNRREQQLTVAYPETPPRVRGDGTRLTQVLVNLLANASKYGPIGQTIELQVTLGADETVRVGVADRGPGLSAAMRDKVFHRFTRFSPADGPQHGVGLGLWIVNVIIREHGGAVGVDERPGGGAIFWFTLPRAA